MWAMKSDYKLTALIAYSNGDADFNFCQFLLNKNAVKERLFAYQKQHKRIQKVA